MEKKEKLSSVTAADLGLLEYKMQCAADLALCLAMVAESGNVPESQMGNALYALHNHLCDLHNEQLSAIDSVISRGKGASQEA